jgi:hypothetical protein
MYAIQQIQQEQFKALVQDMDEQDLHAAFRRACCDIYAVKDIEEFDVYEAEAEIFVDIKETRSSKWQRCCVCLQWEDTFEGLGRKLHAYINYTFAEMEAERAAAEAEYDRKQAALNAQAVYGG